MNRITRLTAVYAVLITGTIAVLGVIAASTSAASAPSRTGPVPLRLDRRLGSSLVWSAAGPYSDDHVLVGFRRGTSARREQSLESRAGAIRRRGLGSGVLLIVPRGDVLHAIEQLKRDPTVRYAEPDYAQQASAAPNDPQFGLLWGLKDEHAVPAWNVTTGSRSIVIAETDTGIDYAHPDLAANMWSNPGGLDGCRAGTHGFDVIAGEGACDPTDEDTTYGGHGTHVAGIMAAVGNNGIGVTGVNWRSSIMAVKWLDSASSGLTSNLIAGLQLVLRAKQAGQNIRVVNDSVTFVGTAYSQALSDEIDQLGANNILFVTAAGNTGANNDDGSTSRYPCNYDRPTEICVAASDQNDRLPSWANYGANTVDLAAPGNGIYSTLRNATYGYLNGSSMASAEVSGAAALILSAGNQSVRALKADILHNVDPIPALSGFVRTSGRLDVCRALPGCTLPAGSSIPASSAPAIFTRPKISPSARVGQTLSTTKGVWTGSPTRYTYHWERCNASGKHCAAIAGATSRTYRVGGRDVGHRLKVLVTAANPAGSAAATSAPTARARR